MRVKLHHNYLMHPIVVAARRIGAQTHREKRVVQHNAFYAKHMQQALAEAAKKK